MNESLWLDEATTALVSKMPIIDLFAKFLPSDFHPPLYYLFMHYWVGIFGDSEVALRIPSLIFSLLAIYVVCKSFGKIVAILLATGPLVFYYAQEARMYSMAMFLAVGLISSFVKISKKGSVGDWVLFSVFLSLLFLTDYVAVLIIPAIWIGAWLLKNDSSWWRKFIMSHIILFVSMIVWLPTFLKQLKNGLMVSTVSTVWSEVLGKTSLKNLVLIPIKFMIGRIGFDNKLVYISIVALVGLIFTFLIIKGRKVIKIVWLWLLVPLILASFLSFRISFLTYFRFLFVLPALYILLADGIKNSGSFKKLLFFLVVAINLSCIFYYAVNPRFHREDWRSLVAFINSRKIADSAVVFVANSNMEAYRYYDRSANLVGPDGVSSKYNQIWLMRYVQEVFDPSDSVRKHVESLGYAKQYELNYNGVVVWEYNK